MDTVTVMRIETPDGRGPFSRAHLADLMNAAMGDADADWHDEFPTGHEAFGPLPASYVCGTGTARDLVRWFPAPMRDVLAAHGFGISVYTVPACDVRTAPGAMQVAFRRHRDARIHRPLGERSQRVALREHRRHQERATRTAMPVARAKAA
jgi:hypothetical protein